MKTNRLFFICLATICLWRCASYGFAQDSGVVWVDSTPAFNWTLETTDAPATISPYVPMKSGGEETWYESTFYVGEQQWARVGRDWQHPSESAASVRAFRVPRAGVVEISGFVGKAHVDSDSDGVNVSIRFNDRTIWQDSLEGADAKGVRFFIEKNVKKGDVFRFVVARKDKHFCDTTRWNPTISFVDASGAPLETYVASEGFDAGADSELGALWSYESLPDVVPNARPKPEDFGKNFGATIRYEWLQEDKISPCDRAAYRAAASNHLAKARLLFDDLAESLDEDVAQNLEAQLVALEKKASKLASDAEDGTAAERFYVEVRGLKRKIVFSNKLFTENPLLFVKRTPSSYSHLVMQYFGWRARKGGGIFRLDKPGESFECRDIFDGRLQNGSVLEPRLSFDAKKLVFSWVDLSSDKAFDPYQVHFNDPDEGFYHVWSASVDGTDLKQLTSGSFDDITPNFLPDGKIVFSSTRRRGYARCFWWGFGRRWHVYTLHSMNDDGSNIKTLSWHDTNEWFPEVANDGRIVYARWDYIDRDAVTHQNLWTTRPDGTNPAALWGNATPKPHCSFQVRAIPNSRKFVFTASAHHSIAAGPIVLVDPTIASDGQEALTRVTPEVPFPEAESLSISEYYDSPFPLSEKYFFVSYSPEKLRWEGEAPQNPGALGIYALDVFGNRELVYRDPEIGATNPIPLLERETPPVWSSQLPENAPNYGEMSVVDVYKGLGAKVERGSIKELRIVQLFPKTTRDADNPPIGKAREENGRAILGTVPVESDGSAYFKVPAQTPFYLQALDADGNAYQTMRSLTYLQPGEKISCVGCHERRDAGDASGLEAYSADASQTLAAKREPSEITPGKLGGRPFAFPHDVQPILNARCVACHDGERNAGGLDLTGVPEGEGSNAFTRSYIALTNDRDFWGEGTNPKNAAEALVPRFGGRNQIQATEPGGMYGALGSRLMKLLREGHMDVELTDEELRTLATWIDLNAIFYGVDQPEAQEAIRAGKLVPMPDVQ